MIMDTQIPETMKLDQDHLRIVAKPGRSRLLGRFIGLSVILLVIGALIWYFRPAGHQNQNTAHHGPGDFSGPVPVAAAIVQKGDVHVLLPALGIATPLATVTVRTQISGQLMQIGFTEGQLVKQGDFLAQVDPRPYQLTLEQDQGQLERDQALLKEAQLDLERYSTLVKQDSIAKQQYDVQASLVQQYMGTVRSDQSQVDSAKLNLIYCHITAPVTGRVGLRQVDQGNYVQTSDTNGIVVITQLQPITVIFTLPEDNIPAILQRMHELAQQGNDKLPVTVFDRADNHKLGTGVLMTIDNQIDTTTGTVKLRAQFDNADEMLFPNQFVNTQLLLDTLHDTPTIPAAGVQRGQPGTFVYLVQSDNTVKIQPITLGPTEGDVVAVTAGLSPGDKVVVDGTDKLRDGAQITLPNEQKPAGPAADATKPPAGQHKHHHDHSGDQ